MLHTVRAINAALPYLEKSKSPAIVIVSSVSGREVDFTGPAYGAFKRRSSTRASAWPSNWRPK